MDATAGGAPQAKAHDGAPAPLEYRHTFSTRVTHWLSALALLVLVTSGLQIFNAAPHLEASDKSNPARRVLSIEGGQTPDGRPLGQVVLFGHAFTTTHWLGYTDDGMGSKSERAFPGLAHAARLPVAGRRAPLASVLRVGDRAVRGVVHGRRLRPQGLAAARA